MVEFKPVEYVPIGHTLQPSVADVAFVNDAIVPAGQFIAVHTALPPSD